MTLFAREATREDGPIGFAGNSLVVNLEWSLAADLDLAAICDGMSDNDRVMVFFEQPGRRSAAPFVHLQGDSCGGGRTKMRKEHMVITRADASRAIHIFVWDHKRVMDGKPAAFLDHNDAVSVKVIDADNKVISSCLIERSGFNCVHVLTIENNHVEVVDNSIRVANTAQLSSGLIDLIDRHKETHTAAAI
ncbi:MAG: hypothetical protein MO852_16840 [Candidatus Devosia euplotis]|nr:hypothetical protein [Candidatus Devosia euplotis]